MFKTVTTTLSQRMTYKEIWEERKKVIRNYLPKAKSYNKTYAKRRNIWRNNVPKRIRKFVSVPEWFVNLDSLYYRKPKITYKNINNIGYWFKKLINYIKKLFKL